MNPFSLVDYKIYRLGEGLPAPDPAKAYEYILAGNGVYKRATNAHLTALIRIADADVAGLGILPRYDLALTHGRIHGDILNAVARDARYAAGNGKEQMYHFRYSRKSLAMYLARPDQEATAARIEYQVGGTGDDIVCDLHSHGYMHAFWSDTDNADETAFRLYAVIGNFRRGIPEIRMRVGMYGDFCPVPATEFFTHTGPFRDLSGEAR